ncbi:hypothetical protein [Anaerobacillus sp. 1_MG-2023]|uniref:hypothetical protein n=1 Tax=Bacillales TaxID=1385 RepID=UPI0026E412A1|nr:hypothetical protein [Anaerobacillus sp. 1_MG-2023]MDO6654403.1 hypothetical protein [Anaerobacillus sp. 1_MG-2023]
MMGIGLTIVLFIVSLFILYVVIESAVRRGINSSVIGKYLEEKHGMKEEHKPSFLDHDLDSDE